LYALNAVVRRGDERWRASHDGVEYLGGGGGVEVVDTSEEEMSASIACAIAAASGSAMGNSCRL
jgi:hypothetical protein